MEQDTSIRYEAKNDGSYNELAAYAANVGANASLFPEYRTIIINGSAAKDVGKFIDENGLDFFIAPIEINDDNLYDIINTKTIDADTMRKAADIMHTKMQGMKESHCEAEAEMKKRCADTKTDLDMYRRWYSECNKELDRVKRQVRAMAIVLDSIFCEES